MFAPPWPRAQTALSWCGGRKAGRGSGPHCVALVPLSPFLAKDMFYLKPRKHAAHFLCGILDSPPLPLAPQVPFLTKDLSYLKPRKYAAYFRRLMDGALAAESVAAARELAAKVGGECTW